jgi:glycerol-3-phosphate dehydrogenase
LRRVRIGMLLANGAKDHFERIRNITQPELGWNDEKWKKETDYYFAIWQKYYSPRPG